MSKAALFLLLASLTSCQNEKDEITWFFGSWISDAELTIQDNFHLAEIEPERVEVIRSMLGSLRWEVTRNNFTVISPYAATAMHSAYSVRDASDARFHFVSEEAGEMIIRKEGESICADLYLIPGINPTIKSECFSRFEQ